MPDCLSLLKKKAQEYCALSSIMITCTYHISYVLSLRCAYIAVLIFYCCTNHNAWKIVLFFHYLFLMVICLCNILTINGMQKYSFYVAKA